VLAESGSPALPFRLQVAGGAGGAGGGGVAGAGRGKPWYGRWWVWGLVGAAVVGGSVAVYAGTRPEEITTFEARTNN
jgi:hypothetical protein